jgi:hypothetical protein
MSAQELELRLRSDLGQAADLLADDRSARDLYRSLANVAWTNDDVRGAHLALSWRSAEDLVNDLREKAGRPALELAQTGGEGEVADTVRALLDAAGWHARPATTGANDPDHLDAPELL